MNKDDRAKLSKAVLSIVTYLEEVPLPERFEAMALVTTWLQIESAREQRAKQAQPVKDEHFDA